MFELAYIVVASVALVVRVSLRVGAHVFTVGCGRSLGRSGVDQRPGGHDDGDAAVVRADPRDATLVGAEARKVGDLRLGVAGVILGVEAARATVATATSGDGLRLARR
jgi:hypothetical protein